MGYMGILQGLVKPQEGDNESILIRGLTCVVVARDSCTVCIARVCSEVIALRFLFVLAVFIMYPP